MQFSIAQLAGLGLYIAIVAAVVFCVVFKIDAARAKERSESLSAEVRHMHDQAEDRTLRFMVFQYALWLSARKATVETTERPADGLRVTQIIERL